MRVAQRSEEGIGILLVAYIIEEFVGNYNTSVLPEIQSYDVDTRLKHDWIVSVPG